MLANDYLLAFIAWPSFKISHKKLFNEAILSNHGLTYDGAPVSGRILYKVLEIWTLVKET